MPTTTVRDRTIFYREFGDAGLPPLVLVHGLYGDSSSVAETASALAARFRVIAPDAIGHGRSERPASFTLEEQGWMLGALVKSLGYDSAAMVGISMGSYLAAQAAILEPERVSHLVLVVGKAHGTTSSSLAYAAKRGVDLATATPEQLMAVMEDAIYSRHTSPELREQLRRSAENADPATILGPEAKAAVERSLAGFDLRPDLGRITAPTLVISGLDDGLNPPEAGQELADLIPDAAFVVYDRSGHALTWEEPDRLVADITAFVLR